MGFIGFDAPDVGHEQLLRAFTFNRYDNDATCCLLPEEMVADEMRDGYNSNSFAIGLADLVAPVETVNFPASSSRPTLLVYREFTGLNKRTFPGVERPLPPSYFYWAAAVSPRVTLFVAGIVSLLSACAESYPVYSIFIVGEEWQVAETDLPIDEEIPAGGEIADLERIPTRYVLSRDYYQLEARVNPKRRRAAAIMEIKGYGRDGGRLRLQADWQTHPCGRIGPVQGTFIGWESYFDDPEAIGLKYRCGERHAQRAQMASAVPITLEISTQGGGLLGIEEVEIEMRRTGTLKLVSMP